MFLNLWKHLYASHVGLLMEKVYVLKSDGKQALVPVQYFIVYQKQATTSGAIVKLKQSFAS